MATVLAGDAAVRAIQKRLAEAGFYEGAVDGAWGGVSQGALERVLAAAAACAEDTSGGISVSPVPEGVDDDPRMAWGAKVSPAFRARIRWVAEQLASPGQSVVDLADDLMSCIAWESAETFSPAIKNAAGSGATGLIQFMPKTAISLGTTVQALAAMSAEDQINYVYKYFRPFKGRLANLGDVYMAILWPLGVGKPDSYVLWDQGERPTTYRQNAGLDINRDGRITRAECIAKILEKRSRGFLPAHVWPGSAS